MSRKKWTENRANSHDTEAIEFARGLYTSKVAVERPPTFSQHGVFHYTSGRPVSAKSLRTRPSSAKARISTNKCGDDHIDRKPTTKPPWRPFSGQASLTRNRTRKTGSRSVNRDQHEEKVPQNTSDKQSDVPLVYRNRQLPKGIAGLQKYLTVDVPSDWCGIDPQSSFIFLPCLSSIDTVDLPVVPEPQSASEPLPFKPEPKPWKYKPPPKSVFWKYLKANDDSCTETRADEKVEGLELIEQLARLGITQERKKQLRTTEIIRREIEDLENLLKGIGNPNASSIISQYQHEINLLRNAARQTVEEYVIPNLSEEELQESKLRQEYAEFAREHDEIIKAIKQRRDKCVRELAALEKKIMNS